MKLEFPGQILEKFSSIKINENPPSGSRVVSCGQTEGWTDMPTLMLTRLITDKE